MNLTIQPRFLRGEVKAIPSKSMTHRYLICAALADRPTQLRCAETSRDIEATADCLRALGAEIIKTDSGYTVFPIQQLPSQAELYCRDSGSTLRFLLPIVGALGVDSLFHLEGRLPERPLSPLWEEMERMGCVLSKPDINTVRCSGRLTPGSYSIRGDVSSQFITGLLFATSLMNGPCGLTVTGRIESKSYLEMTKEALNLFQAPSYHSPGFIHIEGDWSNGAFWVAAQFLGNGLSVCGLNAQSVQGDRAVVDIARTLSESALTISAADIPDLVPILSVMAAANHGAVFTDIHRLRLKESDRVSAIVDMITALGGSAEAADHVLTVGGTGLSGGTVDARGDHRIAMAAAIAATICTTPVTILGADAVSKSYPSFWDTYKKLGGIYEQHIR